MDERSLRKTSDAEKYWNKDIQSMSLLGNKGIELLLRNASIMINVCSLDHFLKGVVVSQLSEIFGNLSQIFKSNES